MKIRTGFVPNSSSSSFVCEVCGRAESGMDASAQDFDMVNCENGHTFCTDEAIEDIPFGEKASEVEDADEIDYYNAPEKYCPICQFLTFSNYDLAQYLLKLTGIKRDEAFAEVKKLNPRRKKLYEPEYIMYVCTKQNINRDVLMSEVKTKFETYKAFNTFINSK